MSASATFLGIAEPVDTQPLEWPDVLPDHFSYSMGSMHDRCAEQARYRYLHGWKERPKGFLLWGTADSKAAEHNFAQKVDTGTDVPVAEVEEKFVDALETAVNTGQEESGYEADWDKGSLEDTKTRGRALAAAYRKVVAPRVLPVAVEHKFQLVIPALPVPVIGYIDVETEGAVIDRKTASKKWTVPEGNYEAQAKVYQLATSKPIHFHVSTKTQTPGLYTPEEEPTLELPFSKASAAEGEAWVLMKARAILADLKEYGPNEPWPGARFKRQSPCKGMCGFRERCFWWTGVNQATGV